MCILVKKIINLFSLKSLLCLSDCRMIKGVAEETIKERRELQLGVFDGDQEDTGIKPSNYIFKLPSDPQQLLQTEMKILQMEKLESLVVGQFEEVMSQEGIRIRRTRLRFLLVNLLVTKNAAKLKKLILYEHYIVPEVEFPCLQYLKCGRLSSAVVQSAPNLFHVEVSEISLEAIRKLPVDVITFYDAGIWNDSRALSQALSHLINLKRIRLRIGGPSMNLPKLLENFQSLESIHLILDLDDEEPMDELFEAIATHNPDVKILRIGEVRVTDEALVHLAQLKQLSHVDIRSRGGGFSGPAITSYLASTTPSTLKHFKLSSNLMFPHFNARDVQDLIGKMKDEVGNAYQISLMKSL